MSVADLYRNDVYKDCIQYIFSWHNYGDACSECQSLGGHTWSDQSIYQNTLWDMFYGDIWDLNTDTSLAHLHCRCRVEVRMVVDWAKVKEINQLYKIVQSTENSIQNPSEPLNEYKGDELSSVTELKNELNTITSQINTLSEKSDKTTLSLREEVRTLNMATMMLQRSFGNENVDVVMNKLQSLIALAMRTRMALYALEAASGPWGWLYAGVSIGAVAVMGYDTIRGT